MIDYFWLNVEVHNRRDRSTHLFGAPVSSLSSTRTDGAKNPFWGSCVVKIFANNINDKQWKIPILPCRNNTVQVERPMENVRKNKSGSQTIRTSIKLTFVFIRLIYPSQSTSIHFPVHILLFVKVDDEELSASKCLSYKILSTYPVIDIE